MPDAEKNEKNESSGPLTWKVIVLALIWLLPLIFTAGGFFWSTSALADDQEKLEQKVVAIAGKVQAHELVPAHPITAERLAAQEATNRRILEALDRIESAQQKTQRSVDRLCDKANIDCQR